MANQGVPPLQPSPWWVAIGLTAAALVAWAVGSYATGGSNLATPPATDITATTSTGVAGGDLTVKAEAFWRAVGSGEHAAALAALDPSSGLPLSHYAGFATAFEAGLRPEDCRLVSPTSVRCTLQASDPELLDLSRSGAVEAVGSATVNFTDRGIDSFDLPEVINTASNRLLAHATATGGIPAACDRVYHDAADLPPFNTVMAQTEDCARALISLIPAAVASRDG